VKLLSPESFQRLIQYKSALFFGGLLGLYLCSPNYLNTNQYSRFGLTQAIVERQTFEIDPYVYGNDWSFRSGHYYTNKAPGSSMLGVPFYFVLYYIERPLGGHLASLRKFNLDVTDWFVTAIPSVFLSVFVLKYLLVEHPEDSNKAWLTVFTLAVGTIIYPFSTTLWGHPTAAACLFFAYYALVRGRSAWATGVFLGLACLIEYSSILTIPCFLIYYIWQQKERSVVGLLQILVGAAPSFVLFIWYHKTCFGGWFTMPSLYQNPYFGLQRNNRVFHVLALPDPVIMWKLLFGAERGLFLISPILILALHGYCLLLKPRRLHAELIIALPIVLVFWLFNASFVGWRGGGSSGPRYMIPMLPFLALGLARAKASLVFYWLLYVSVLNCAAIMAVTTTATPGRSLVTQIIYPFFESWNPYRVFLPVMIAALCLFGVTRLRLRPPDICPGARIKNVEDKVGNECT
jgi:hypothetical protein